MFLEKWNIYNVARKYLEWNLNLGLLNAQQECQLLHCDVRFHGYKICPYTFHLVQNRSMSYFVNHHCTIQLSEFNMIVHSDPFGYRRNKNTMKYKLFTSITQYLSHTSYKHGRFGFIGGSCYQDSTSLILTDTTRIIMGTRSYAVFSTSSVNCQKATDNSAFISSISCAFFIDPHTKKLPRNGLV
jgi:hypothetical protein